VSFKLNYITNNNLKIYPFSGQVKGFLTYCENNYMAVQIRMPRKYPVSEKEKTAFKLEEPAQTLKTIGYLAYYGKFEIDIHHHRIMHHLEGSICPANSGRERNKAL